jgi:gamma-glutamylcyclotransferase
MLVASFSRLFLTPPRDPPVYPADVLSIVQANPDADLATLLNLVPAHTKPVVYFAYGSNMSTKVFDDRRKMKYLAKAPCVVHDFRLCFDLPGFPPFEPAFANLEPSPGSKVHGVAYLINQDFLSYLHYSEGGGRSYLFAHAKGTLYNHHQTSIDIVTLVCPPDRCMSAARQQTFPPSKRYMTILRDGARAHKLDSEWVAKLEALPAVKLSGVKKLVEALLLGGVGVPLLLVCFMVISMAKLLLSQERAEFVKERVIRTLRESMWLFSTAMITIMPLHVE